MGLEFWKLPSIILFGYGYIHFHIHICVKISYHILFCICLINSDTDNFHFRFGSDADVSDTNRHFLEYEYRIFRIIRYQFPPLCATVPGEIRSESRSTGLTFSPRNPNFFHTLTHHNFLTVAPIRGYSISKCLSQRLHHFISLHHFHLSSSWCLKCYWKRAMW